MQDDKLADEIISRLNDLIKDSDICIDINKLINKKVICSQAAIDHKTIQVSKEGLSFLGLLNGIVGAIQKGNHKGYGYITAVFDDFGKLIHFKRTIE